MRTWIKVKKAGVTQDVVDQIKRTWRRNELAMIKFDIPLCRNMDRAREIVEVLACPYSSSSRILLNCLHCNCYITENVNHYVRL